MDLKEKTCLVTGGTKGIGKATAEALAAAGADVAIVGRNRDREAEETLKAVERYGRRSCILTADMAKAEDAERCVRETIDELGSVDVLIHSAGGLVPGGLFEVTPEEWKYGFDVHVNAVFHLARAVIPSMRERGGGAIILISSVAGIRAIKTNVAYQVVKGALPQFTRALAYEFADDRIRVNAVAPGIIRTRFHDSMTEDQKRYNLEHRIPLHREGTPAEVASLILELVRNDYITGETVVVDGGLTMRIA